MYCKFSVVEFATPMTMNQQPTCYENMPKKRGRPPKNSTKSNHALMIVKSTEIFPFSMHAFNVDDFQIVFKKEKKLKRACPYPTIVKPCHVESEASSQISSHSNSISSNETSSPNVVSNLTTRHDANQQPHVVKNEAISPSLPPRKIRSSISIRELLN